MTTGDSAVEKLLRGIFPVQKLLLGEKGFDFGTARDQEFVRVCEELGLRGDMSPKEAVLAMGLRLLGLDSAELIASMPAAERSEEKTLAWAEDCAVRRRTDSIQYPLRAVFLELLMADEHLKALRDEVLPRFEAEWRRAIDRGDAKSSASFAYAATLFCHAETPGHTPFPRLFADTHSVLARDGRSSLAIEKDARFFTNLVNAKINTEGDRSAYEDAIVEGTIVRDEWTLGDIARYLDPSNERRLKARLQNAARR